MDVLPHQNPTVSLHMAHSTINIATPSILHKHHTRAHTDVESRTTQHNDSQTTYLTTSKLFSFIVPPSNITRIHFVIIIIV